MKKLKLTIPTGSSGGGKVFQNWPRMRQVSWPSLPPLPSPRATHPLLTIRGCRLPWDRGLARNGAALFSEGMFWRENSWGSEGFSSCGGGSGQFMTATSLSQCPALEGLLQSNAAWNNTLGESCHRDCSLEINNHWLGALGSFTHLCTQSS